MSDKKTAFDESFEQFDEEEGRKLMAQHLKARLDKMCMHPHQRDSAAALTLDLLKKRVMN